MNFKRNLISIIALIASAFTVSGCRLKNNFEQFSFINEITDLHQDEEFADGAYVRPGNYSDFYAVDKTENLEEFGSYHETMTVRAKKSFLEAEGDRKILVVPVEFIGYSCAKLNISQSEYIDNLNKAFFGKAKNNRYVSVSEYYNRSSYGKLRLSGKVCDKFYTFSIPFESLNTYVSSNSRQRVYDEYDAILAWYIENYGEEDLDQYRIDPENPTSDVALYLVYTFPSDLPNGNGDFFWAYTFERKPISWTSYSTLSTVTGEPDAHTFIHETGHLFGLVDYYPKGLDKDVTTSNTVIEPTGEIDMMDSGLGDHSALSKMMLNWARPYHVKKDCEITLKPLINSGDIILINDEWNGTVFDEFYLIEFYSPLGLNALDAAVAHKIGEDQYAKLPNLPGIKIYHVDARLGYYWNKTLTVNETLFSHYCDEVFMPSSEEIKFGDIVNFAHDNSTYPDATEEQKYLRNYLYELELNGVGYALPGCAADSHLFHKGNKFTIGEEFHKAENPTRYEIEVTSLTFNQATIKISSFEAE